jgi:dihydroorotate dehydrogenase electron transfer subunit
MKVCCNGGIMTESSSSSKGVFKAVVTSNREIGQRLYRLRLEFSGAGRDAFAKFKPGQFAQLDISGTALPPLEKIPKDLVDSSGRKILLRRPFSFVDVETQGNRTFADLVYRVVGPASLRMTTLSAGNSLSVIGPLGNGFWIPQDKKKALLVMGGMGAPPLQHLAKVLSKDYADIEITALAGAKTVRELPFEGRLDEISQQLEFALREFAKYGANSLLATDDGTAGYKGPVSECLLQWLAKSTWARDTTIIYACGPEAMLAKVAQIAKDKAIDCQISMEQMMACGIGVCQSCAVPCRVNGSNETVYKLCCEDGPVFDCREVVF